MDISQKIEAQVKEIITHNLFDNQLVSVVLEDKAACQHVLRTILGFNLIVKDVKAQYRLQNLTAHETILDVYAEDENGNVCNIEIQRADTVDHPRRIRYYGSMLDKSILEKGRGYDKLPNLYLVYLSETDIWKSGRAVYFVEKTLSGGIPYDDGQYIVYVNAEVEDGSDVSKLMQFFKSGDPSDMSQGALSERVSYIKTSKGGYQEMVSFYNEVQAASWEEGREIGIKEGVTKQTDFMMANIIRQGGTPEYAASIAAVPLQYAQEIADKIRRGEL